MCRVIRGVSRKVCILDKQFAIVAWIQLLLSQQQTLTPMSRVLKTRTRSSETYMARAIEAEPTTNRAGRHLLVEVVCPSHCSRRMRQPRQVKERCCDQPPANARSKSTS